MRNLALPTIFTVISIYQAFAGNAPEYFTTSTPKRINIQEPRLDEYIFLITDAKDKQIITTAIVRIKDNTNQPVESTVNQKTGEWKALLDQAKSYFVSIEAPGYISVEREIDAVETNRNGKNAGGLISISLKKNESALLALTAIDAITHETIPATFKVLRPEETTLTGRSDKDNPYRIEYSPKKKFTVEISSEGYKTYTEQLLFENFRTEYPRARLQMKQFALKRELYNFLFKIIDEQTRENIVNTRMRILNLKSRQSIAAKIEKDGFSANLSPESEYSVEVFSDGYDQAIQNIDLKDLIAKRKFEQEILLIKKSVDRYRLIVVDDETNKNVPGAGLRIFNAKNEPVSITTTAVQSEWQANLKIEEAYTAEVTTQGYLPYKATLLKNDKTVYLKISKVPQNEILFMATDFYTRNVLPADYQLKAGTTAVEGSLNPEKNRFKAMLAVDKNYELEITSAGYPTFKNAVNITKAVNNVIMVELKKSSYTFTFNPIDALTKEPITNARITLVAADNANLILGSNKAGNEVAVQNLDQKYVLRVQADNYKPYTADINLMNLVASNFSQDVLLEKIAVPPSTPPLSVKNTSQPQETVSAQKKEKPEPPKEEKVVPMTAIPKETAKTPVLAIADNYFKNVEIGKHIKLENVFFDQGQPIIKPQSFPELDKLVDLLKGNPQINIEITGHTDNIGDPRLNLYLSELRAKAVSNYLFNKGVAPGRLISTGKGQQQPVASNDTEENRQKNRRVEFTVLVN